MKHIKSIMDLLVITNNYYDYLQGKISFDRRGWPIFQRKYFLSEWPILTVTYEKRNSRIVTDPARTLICFFSPDSKIYPRFIKVFDEITEYKKFLGVIAPDITVTSDMDSEMQDIIILANQLFMAILAINGIKIVFNTRIGRNHNFTYFKNIPKFIMCASGFLGCCKSKNIFEACQYTDKIMSLLPEKLLIYGKKDPLINAQLETLGINYKYFVDFHSMSKKRRHICGRF